MNRRLILAGAVAAAVTGPIVLGSAEPSFASSLPVTVHVTQQDGGVYVSSTLEGQALVGAGTTSDGICAGISEQVPVCL